MKSCIETREVTSHRMTVFLAGSGDRVTKQDKVDVLFREGADHVQLSGDELYETNLALRQRDRKGVAVFGE